MLLHSARKIATIRARATKGKVTLSTGTRSKLRQQLTSTMAHDTARTNEDRFQFTTSASSKVYIEVKLDSPDATCEVKYTTTKTQTTQKLIVRARVNAGNWCGVVNNNGINIHYSRFCDMQHITCLSVR